MRAEYDFSAAKPNPYTKALRRRVTIAIDAPTLEYFQQLADEHGVGCNALINLDLRDCVAEGRKLALDWPSSKG